MFPRKKDNWPAWAASYSLLNKLWIKNLLETRGNISEFNSEFQAQISKVTTREELSNSRLKVVTINAFLHDSRYYLPCVFPQVFLDSNSPYNGLKEGSFITLKRFSLSYMPINPQRWDPIFRIIDFTHTHGDIPGSQYLPELMNPFYQFVDIKLGSLTFRC
ncbi:hypothetical protein G9A89_020105 [Geosiphon pyriformis]|nr:hypothetical protein G9A89_020105 [Geosiphon pyriformis]